MAGAETYDLFICHAWRFHDDWVKMVEALDGIDGFNWRNFSVPWHDPAFDPNTPEGGDFVRRTLDGQVRPAQAVILLMDVYATKSTRKWLDLEVELAKQFEIPVIAVLPRDGGEAGEVFVGADQTVPWQVTDIAATIEEISGNGRAEG